MARQGQKAVKELLDDIERILKRDGKTPADLARELKRNYQQVYEWVGARKINPSAAALFELQDWREKNKTSAQVPGGDKSN